MKVKKIKVEKMKEVVEEPVVDAKAEERAELELIVSLMKAHAVTRLNQIEAKLSELPK